MQPTQGDIYRDGGDEALRRFLLVERLRGLADMIERTPDDAVVGAHIRELHGVNTLRAAADRI